VPAAPAELRQGIVKLEGPFVPAFARFHRDDVAGEIPEFGEKRAGKILID
jgi:hypothetical protein